MTRRSPAFSGRAPIEALCGATDKPTAPVAIGHGDAGVQLARLAVIAADHERRIVALERDALIGHGGDPVSVAATVIEHLGPADASRLAAALMIAIDNAYGGDAA